MARSGAQIGNENVFHGKLMRQAIVNALGTKSRAGALAALNNIMATVAKKALDGDMEAAKFLAERLDRKAAQSVVLSTAHGIQIEANSRPAPSQTDPLDSLQVAFLFDAMIRNLI